MTEWSMTSSAGASGFTFEIADRLAHGRQVDDAWHSREVLHEYARRGELDLHARLRLGFPRTERANVVGGDVRAILGAQQVLQQHLQAEWQAFMAGYLADLVDVVARVTDAQLALRTEGVEARHVALLSSLCAHSSVMCPARPAAAADARRRSVSRTLLPARAAGGVVA